MTEERTSVRQVLGDNVRRIRDIRKMTVRDLSARLKTMGLRLSPSGISEIENATRKVAVEELLILAIALRTSLIDLLMPPDGESLPVGDDMAIEADDLFYWLRGDTPWPKDVVTLEEFSKATREHHRRMLFLSSDPAVRSVSTLDSITRLARSQPREVFGDTFASALRKQLDEVNAQIADLVEYLQGPGDDGR
ncbi:helix-turn-helix domain-containing protein [Mycobacterium malmoense]|uniref:helix-turn-helix domain-containing protein n=1 Tax=Mycobacterium malmoense TaxID=1780 RepID=UPI00159EE8A2|nr:helix-turn-helix transcriptional regulator [Mycobacterium malmoense]